VCQEDRRPYVVLNAADMASGSVFSFNQDQFDLICAGLAALKIADAVSASASCPVALSSLTLRNRAPCEAQRQAPSVDRDRGASDGASSSRYRSMTRSARTSIDISTGLCDS
jgi:NTE family protein